MQYIVGQSNLETDMSIRFEIRKARFTPVVVASDEWPRPEVLVATEICPRGLFITSDRLVSAHGSVRLSFRLGTSDLWEFEGNVVHRSWRRRRTDPGYNGLGVELTDTSPLARLRMRALLRKHPPPVPLECRLEAARGDGPSQRRRASRWGGRRHDDMPRPKKAWGSPQRILTELA